MGNKLQKHLLAGAISVALSSAAYAEAFRIADVRVEGLQRVSAGTVFSYLPVQPGESFDLDDSITAIQSVYNSGLFSDVKLARDGQTLVVLVKEFPTIAEINIKGNKALKTNDLKQSFAEIGFAEGQSFNPALVNQLTNEMAQQYQARSKYNVEITPTVRNLPRNRVAIDLNISEGRSTRIKEIDIVGNKIYSDDQLIDLFDTTTWRWNSFFTSSDQYNEQRIEKDLERLEDFYLNNGFINFKIKSSEVAVTPDRKDLYWTVTVDEGLPYTITGYTISGKTVVPVSELEQLVSFTTPSRYNRSLVQQTANALKQRLADEGYAQADIEIEPNVDPLTQEVSLNFVVVPGEITYVREINFSGNDKTYDRVLRREMRQQEASTYSASDIQRSEERLRRLPQVATLKQSIVPVPGEDGLVDLNYEITEQSTSFIQGGVGYGEGSGALFNLEYGDNNFFGTGNRLSLGFGKSKSTEKYSFSFTDPYFTADGISATYNLSYASYDFAQEDLSNWASDDHNATVVFGYPLSEYQNIYFGGGYRGLDITLGNSVAKEIRDAIDRDGKKYHEGVLTLSWARDTLDDDYMPTRGTYNRVSAELTTPGSTATYYKTSIQNKTYFNFGENSMVVGIGGQVAYGDGYGKTSDLPFFRHYYAGGISTVRGYQYGSIGPKYSNGDNAGGDFRVNGGAELYFPVGFGKRDASYRVGGFVDFGSVYSSISDFDASDFRYSAGVALQWRSPIGPLKLSWAKPINKKDGDQTESFQFTIGTSF